MQEPKFYLIIAAGFTKAGKYGFQTEVEAQAEKRKWEQQMIKSGMPMASVLRATKVVPA